ncbi:MAG: CBS domain-containing protein [Nitrospirae bacterium]|nr:CBS domain-containing protein [Nitrospirota bacterium]MBI5695907.1 CBS domain-containing protein [Nitrospirota bacterium]
MVAREIMGKVKAPKKNANCRDIAMKLLSQEYSSLPVVDDEGYVVGIISEFDILKALRAGKQLESLTAGDVMTNNPLCVDEEVTVEKLIDFMTEKHLMRVPVVRDGRLVGSISRSNILDSLVSVEFKESFWILRG